MRPPSTSELCRFAAILAVCLFHLPPALSSQDRLPVIDMHQHAHLPDVPAGIPALCRPEPCRGAGSASATSRETLRRTLAEMDRHNVVMGFLSGDLETVRAWKAAAPDRFIASVFILVVGQPSVELLREEYSAGRLAGLGEIATQLHGISPDDPGLEAYFALAEDLDIPVSIHTSGFGPYLPSFRSAAGNPLLLEEVLRRHPKLRIYLENSGYPYLGEMIAMMYQYPQLYADLSTMTWIIPRTAFYGYLEGLIDAGLGKRLMFGSDQMRWPEMIGDGIAAIEEADFLSDTQKRDILYNNAARFLRLDEATIARHHRVESPTSPSD